MCGTNFGHGAKVTLHVSVWVEIVWERKDIMKRLCHAPRERVSWNHHIFWYMLIYDRHAPRERVSWNGLALHTMQASLVTLHVSVWVEIKFQLLVVHLSNVTLHVSVWVEMHIAKKVNTPIKSRSTWACELKCLLPIFWRTAGRSRSTWACELKSLSLFNVKSKSCHAPRERVSWNNFSSWN